MVARVTRTAALALALTLNAAPLTARAFEWPVASRRADDGTAPDLLAAARWDRIAAWSAPAAGDLPALLQRLEARGDDARSLACRAVVLRLLQRVDEARAVMRRARSLDARIALDDPDAALTAAWLDARDGRFEEAFALGLRALSRMPAATGGVAMRREPLVLDLARWSLARGADGLNGAIHLLRTWSVSCPASPRVRATLALALVRRGDREAARALVAPVRDELGFDTTDASALRGAVVRGEDAAAQGVALSLVGRPRDAVAPLTRAVESAPAVWRASLDAELALARRSAP